MKLLKYILLMGTLTLWLSGEQLFAVAAKGTVFVTYGQPGATTSTFGGVSTYNFDSLPLGTDASATWSGVGSFTSLNVLSADSKGGASNSQYMADGLNGVTQTTLTLNSNSPSSYFGLWLSAANSSEVIDFYSKTGSLLAEFTTANLLKALPASYYGNPNSGVLNGTDATQPFAYVNFLATSDVAWSSIVFRSSTVGGTFEADNFASRTTAYNPSTDGAMPGTEFEIIHGGTETALGITSAPEPSPMMAALLIGGISVGGSVLRRIRKASPQVD